jgi:hypothetical protein
VQDRDLYGKPITQTDAERDAINNSGITRLPAAGAETTDPFGHHLVKAVGSIRDAIFPPGVLPSSKAPVVRQMEAAAASLKAQQDSAGGQPAAAPNGWLGESGATQPAAPKQPASDPNQSWLTAFRNGIEKTDTGPYQDALGQYKANSDKAYARDAKERGINSLFAFAKGAMGASQHASVNLGQGFGDMAASRAASTKEMGSNDALRAVHGLQGEQSLMNAQFAQTNNSNMAHVYGRNALAQHERNMLDAAKAAWDARESTYKTKFSEVIAALNAANMMGKMNLTPDQINAEAHKQALDFTKKFTGSDAAYGKINSIGDTGYMNGSLDYNTPGGVPTYKVDPIGTGATAGYMPPTIPAGGITGVQPTALTNPQG